MKIHEKIKKLREHRQLSQAQMAAKLNLSTSGYAKIEQGERGLDVARLEKIASALGVALPELWAIGETRGGGAICLLMCIG